MNSIKRFLAIALLVTASAQANGLKKAWDNFGKHNRLVSSAKSAIVFILGVSAAQAAIDNGIVAGELLGRVMRNDSQLSDKVQTRPFSKKSLRIWQLIALTGVTSGATAYATYHLLYHQLFKDLKHALNIKDGWFS